MRRDLLVPLETELLSVPELSYDDGLVVKEECDRLFGFIETQLSERERSILKLFLSGLSYGEIAQNSVLHPNPLTMRFKGLGES